MKARAARATERAVPAGLALGMFAFALLSAGGIAMWALAASGGSDSPRIIPVDPARAARAALERGDLAEASAHLDKAVELNPKDRELRLLRARVLGMRGRIFQAALALRELIKGDPGDATAVAAMSELLEAGGETEQAMMYLQRAVQLRPDDAYLWKRLAKLQIEAGRALEALATIQRSLELDPGQEDLEGMTAELSKLPLGPQALPDPGRPRIPGTPRIPGMPRIPDPKRFVQDPGAWIPGHRRIPGGEQTDFGEKPWVPR